MEWKQLNNHSTVLEVVMAKSGMTEEELLNPKAVRPEEIENLVNAASVIKKAVENNEHISIMGDYDADGITSSAILFCTLKKLGNTPQVRLPRRMSEGYGLSIQAVKEFPKGLLITVDNGIAAHSAIDFAKDNGLKVVVIDHHLMQETLPDADVIVDPHVNPGNTNIQMSKICELFENSPLPIQQRNLLEITKMLPDIETHVIKAVDDAVQTLKLINLQAPDTAIRTILKKFNKGFPSANDFEYADRLTIDTVYLGTLLFLAQDFRETNTFLKTIKDFTDRKTQPSVNNNITLSTIHSAKGLEFDNVIILDAINGLLPQDNFEQTVEIDSEEDSRLFYVGVTRAKNKVEFIIPKNLYGISVTPSRFIERLEKNTVLKDKPNENISKFKEGMRVTHTTFGNGVIISVAKDVLTIKFDSSGTRRILDTFCKILN